jgi:hypothetical protein
LDDDEFAAYLVGCLITYYQHDLVTEPFFRTSTSRWHHAVGESLFGRESIHDFPYEKWVLAL